jgi:hypothetical protein
MRGLVHEDGEAELPRADDEEGHDDRQRVRPARDERERGPDDRPVDRDREPAPPVAHDQQLPDVVAGERLAPDGSVGAHETMMAEGLRHRQS